MVFIYLFSQKTNFFNEDIIFCMIPVGVIYPQWGGYYAYVVLKGHGLTIWLAAALRFFIHFLKKLLRQCSLFSMTPSHLSSCRLHHKPG